MSAPNKTAKDLIPYYPEYEKPCTTYESLADACLEDFSKGEGYITTPYVDCLGHLTIGIGTLLYHKTKGEKGLSCDDKSRFDLCGFSAKQKELLISATKALQPNDYMSIKDEKSHFITKKIGKNFYKIEVRRIPGAGAKIMSVQKNKEAAVKMRPISDARYRDVFHRTFKEYYTCTINTIKNLHELPKSLQCLAIHQFYGRGSFPEAKNVSSIDQIYMACADSIRYRKERFGVSSGELEQLDNVRKIVNDTHSNARRGRIVPKKLTPKEQAIERQKRLEERIRKSEQRRFAIKADNTRVVKLAMEHTIKIH